MAASTAPLDPQEPEPSLWKWTIGFLLIGMAWGLTTPFMRRAALNHNPPVRPSLVDPKNSYLKRLVLRFFFGITDMLRRPAYTIPFVLNITGSVWFFLLIGKAELSLTVPITNSLAFLFTVLGEWWVEKKGIGLETWIGMALVLTGIGLCVNSKS